MNDLLSPADVQNLMLLSALKTDGAMNERIEKMLAAHKAIEATLEQVRAERAAAQEEREEGRKALAHARLLAEESVARAGRLADSEKGLGESITTHNADKQSFNEIRAQIEADLKERTAKLEADEADVAQRSKALSMEESKIHQAGETMARLHDRVAKAHSALYAALSDEAADAPGAEAGEPVVIAPLSWIKNLGKTAKPPKQADE